MLKILILLIVIVSVAFISYQLGFKSTTQSGAENINEEIIDNSNVVLDTSKVKTNTSDNERAESDSLVLDLSGRGLTETPGYVFGETNVEVLNLSRNNLTGSLQAEVRNLQNLRELNLANNQFTGVPAEIGQLKYLEVLDLSNNRITGLPLELGNLSNLKVLNLKGNEYSKYDLGLIKEKLPSSIIIELD